MTYLSTPILLAVYDVLARLDWCIGLRVRIANERWRRDELEELATEAREARGEWQ